MSSWQEQLFEAIEDGNTSLITTLIATEGLEANVDRKVFFSRIAYKGPKKSFVYVAQVRRAHRRVSQGGALRRPAVWPSPPASQRGGTPNAAGDLDRSPRRKPRCPPSAPSLASSTYSAAAWSRSR